VTSSADVPRTVDPPGDAALASAAAELYTAPPEEFTERRKELAASARAAGDRAAAQAIAALRKPTRAAWVVNRLAHAEPGTPARLADLAAGLRAAESAKDGTRLRELTARRRALVDSLASQALALAGLADPPPALREEVSATLAAALADPEVAAHLASGTLTRAATWSGFGLASQLPADPEAPLAAALPPAPPPAGPGSPAPVRPVALPPQAPRPLPPPRAASPGHGSSIPDAERSVATAAAIAAAAAAAEELLEVRVRDLEQQLTKARADLADARQKARHAEAAERKARQALARLTGS
jgi:hypothetical protein